MKLKQNWNKSVSKQFIKFCFSFVSVSFQLCRQCYDRHCYTERRIQLRYSPRALRCEFFFRYIKCGTRIPSVLDASALHKSCALICASHRTPNWMSIIRSSRDL